jgi:predicted nucleic acid-binding Zn ribbon protein
MAAPTESKVFGATLGGGAGAVFTSFVLWLFGVFVFGVPSDADSAGAAIGAVPLPLAGVLTAVLTLGAVYGGGWLAKHTPRPDETVPAPSPPPWTRRTTSTRTSCSCPSTRPSDMCKACQKPILVTIFRGEVYCSDNCRRVLDLPLRGERDAVSAS